MDDMTNKFLNKLTMEDLRKIAFIYNHIVKIKGVSKLKKHQLIHELQKYLFLHPETHRLAIKENRKTVSKYV